MFNLRIIINFYTNVLRLPSLSDERQLRLNLINGLYGRVMDFRKISNYLNGNGFVTPCAG